MGDRKWTTADMIQNASNWSLAGDAHLLAYLESFSENMLAKAEETYENLNKLMTNLDNTSLSLDMVKREFFSLHNTQFVESRVYEDDYSDSANVQEQSVVDKGKEDDNTIEWKDAIRDGIDVVNNYYDRVEVPGSDSEDETDFPSYVLRPKDLYSDRHLPYIIGSDEWHKKWHVGLLDTSSESEEENIFEKFSESDSDDLSIHNKHKFSEDESISDILQNVTSKRPVANSTFEDNTDVFGDNQENNSGLFQTPISTNSFANELVRKLGHVIEQNPKIVEPEVNRKPIQNYTSNAIIGNLFDDEPPPLNENDDLFGSDTQKGFFSGGGGLFDDVTNIDTWNKDKEVVREAQEHNIASKQKMPDLFDDHEDLFSSGSKERDSGSIIKPKPTQKVFTTDLFDDPVFDNDEDDLFKDVISNPYKKPYLPSSSNTIPYIADEPPELDFAATSVNNKHTNKKPIGGINIFGNADIFGQHNIGELTKAIQHSKKPVIVSNVNTEESDIPVQKKLNDLFDDFSNVSINSHIIKTDIKEKSQAVTEISTDAASKDELIFSAKPNSRSINLFDDIDDNELFGDDLFSNISVKKFTSDLFSDELVTDNLYTQASKKAFSEDVFPSPKETISGSYKSNNESTNVEENENKRPELFVDKNSNIEDLSINEISKASIHADEPIDKPNININITQNKNRSINIDLFNENPPDLDDAWDSKSDNLFDDNENLFDSTSVVTGQRSGLFDDEPPSLFSESSGIVKDMSTRVEIDDSFNPYASSSRRFSADIFNEQQSSDSFFITKNRSNIDYRTQSNLDIIPEDISNIENLSATEISASGNVASLYSDSTYDCDFQQSNISDDLFSQNVSKIRPLSKSFMENVVSKHNSEDLFFNSSINVFDALKSQPNSNKMDIFQSTVLEKKSISNSLFEDGDDSDIFFTKQGKPTKTSTDTLSTSEEPVSDTNVKITNHLEQPLEPHSESVLADAFASKIGSPGKLKLNLNINIDALKPGSGIISKKDVDKSLSLESEVLQENTTGNIEAENIIDQSPTEPENSNASENESQILLNITKDRARIPVKRRPSSRKARQEAMRNSIADFRINSLDNSPMEEVNPVILGQEIDEQTTVSDSDHNLPSTNNFVSENKDNDTSKPKEKDVVSIRRNSFTSSSLFDDPENFDDIFSSIKAPAKNSTLKHSSLFDEDFDDDDIFGSSSVAKANNDLSTSKDEIKKPLKITQITKLENTTVTDDPLSLFQE